MFWIRLVQVGNITKHNRYLTKAVIGKARFPPHFDQMPMIQSIRVLCYRYMCAFEWMWIRIKWGRHFQQSVSVQFKNITSCLLSNRGDRGKKKTFNPEENECGYQPVVTRIFGGIEADIHEFPWMTLLQYSSRSGIKQACSASLINKQYLITAAHCADPRAIREMGYNKL